MEFEKSKFESRVRAVIFDLDGLIVDTEPLHQKSFNVLLARHKIEYVIDEKEYGREFVGVPVEDNFDYLVSRFNFQSPMPVLIAEREQIFISLASDPQNLNVMPGARKLIDRLNMRGIPFALATGSARDEATTMLRGIGFTNYFRAIVTGSDVARGKPAPDIYLKAVSELKIDPAKCLALEDSAAGVASAKSAGLRVIVVPNRFTAQQDLWMADARVASLEKVKDILK